MKKVAFLITLLITTIGVSQNAPINFETGGQGADWTWTVFENDDNPPLDIIANPVPSGDNVSATVARFSARDNAPFFAGVESMHGSDLGTFDITSANSTINIMVYKTKISNVGIKLVRPNGAAQAELLVANTLINQWEMLTFDFSVYIGAGNTTGVDQIVIFPDFIDRTADDIILFDNITFGPQVAGGNIELPVDFEDDTLDYTIGTFNGTDAAVEANPVSGGINTSATVVRSTKNVAAAFFAGNVLDLDTPIDFTSSTMISLKSYSPKLDIPIRLALENQVTGNQIVVDVTNTALDTWETLTFDFTGVVDPAISYDRVIVFFEFIVDLPGDGSTYYFDDVEVAAPMGDPVVLPITFEDINVEYAPIGFEGADSAVEANPVSGGINTSDTVLRSTKTVDAQFFAGTAINLGTPIDFTESEVITIKTYSPKMDIPVKLRLENADNTLGIEVDVNTTVTDEWETLSFDFTGLTAGTDFVRVVVFFEFIADLPGDGSTYYFDDVEVFEILFLDENNKSNLVLFPNPTIDALTIQSNDAIATIEIYSMLGQRVIQSKINGTSATIDVSGLTNGMYVLNTSYLDGSTQTLKFIKRD